MNLIKRFKVLMFAVVALSFANSSFGQASVGCPNFNFENGNTPWTNPNPALWWNAGWYLDRATYIGTASQAAWGAWSYNVSAEDEDTYSSGYGAQRFFQMETDVNATDNFTGGQLKKVHPGSPYSARIGTPNGGTHGEQLRYSFTVSAENCLLTFYYAMVLPSPSHTGYVNPTFQIDVVEGNGMNASAPLVKPCAFFEKNGNTQLPTLEPGVWHNSTFTDSNGPYIYCDWQRVAIDLMDQIGHTVTVRIRMSDCAQTQHGGWGYFVGEASNPSLQASGCSQGANIVEVVAPAGFAAYQWYINPSNNPDLAAVAITANEIPAIHSGTNDTLFVTQESNIMQGQPLQHVFVKLTSVSTTVGIPACIGYQSIDITDVKPRADFTVKNNGTLDIQFTNTSDTLTNARKPDYYKWEFDDGSPDVEWHAGDDLALWSPMHTYASCGTKHVILTASKGICSHVVEKDIFIPCLNVMDDTLICVGTEYRSIAACSNEIDLTNPAFIWTNPAEDTLSTTNSYTHSYQESDTLIVTISAYNESTSSTLSMRDTVIVSVQQFPEIQLEGDTILCLGETANIRAIDLSGSVTGMKWVYTRPTEPYNMSGATTSPILPTFQPTKDTTVYLLAQTSQGCIVWDSITIHVVKPEIHASKLKVCPGQPVVLWGTNAQSYTWTAEPDDPAIPTTYIDTITVYPNVTTTYTMAGYGSSGCHADKSVTIEVIPYPTAIINYSPEYVDVSSPAVSFTDVSPYSTSSRWDFSDGSTSNARSLTYRFSDVSTDTVWIRLTTYNELGCSDDTTIHLPVLIFSVWVPTAFSPDGDGLNDRLFIYTLNVLYDLSFEVYNRWGTIVYSYSTKELRPEAIANMQNVLGWDGTVNGSQAGQGTYVYRLQYKMQGSSRVYDKTGTVNLVK